jgi:U3 small nucleolar RNA-associated protein 22
MAKRTREEVDVERFSKKPSMSKSALIDTITQDIDQVSSDGDLSDYDSEEEQQAQKSNLKKSAGLSSEDVQIARETAELFKSNIFKLQIDELIKEVTLKDTKVAKIEKFLHKLYDLIQDIPEFKDRSIEQVDSWFRDRKTAVPFNDPKPTNVNYKFGYGKPENVSIVGSFGLKTAIQLPRGLSVDVNVTMPADLFQQKDYLNYRALHKRAFYLGYLTENLRTIFKKEKLDFLKLSYTYLNGDSLSPVLKIQAADNNPDSELNFHRTKFSINVLIGFPFGIFDAKKLLPNKNCIRVQKDEEIELPPTPLYNSSVLTMTTYDHYLKFLYKTKKSAEQFKQACILGRIWLSQRGLDSSIQDGGFGHFEFAALAAALLNGGGQQGNKILLHGFSSYQLFKGVIKYLATEDLCTEGYLQFHSDSAEMSKYIKGGFKTPTVFDKTTKINLLHRVTRSSYNLLVKHARKTLVLLNDVVKDRFEPLFLKNSNLEYLKFDYTVHFQMSPSEDDTFGPFEKIINLTYENYLSFKISNIVNYGVGDRIAGFNVSFDRIEEFDVSKRKPQYQQKLNVKIGLLIDPLEAEKLVIKGPSETEESSQFRSFWGPKSSLRRFKDGTILHSVIWSTDYKEPVVLAIIKYLFKRHIKEDIKIISEVSQFNQLLPLPNLPSSSKQSVISPVAFNGLLKSYDELYKILIKLELPLAIKSVLPASPSLRFTSQLQPVPYAVSSKDFFNDLVLQFETSVKWPDELAALEKVKTAFLIKIHEILSKETAYRSELVRDDESVPYNFNITTLNIMTPEGYGFRIRVLTERDEVLYLRAIENAPKEKRQVLESIYLSFNRRYQGSITHTRVISTISHQFPFYSATVRLFKKWLDDQLLLTHFSEELIELIALQPFVDPAQYDVPASVSNGFLRILSFLAQWNWREDPLIMDLSKKAEDDDSEIVSKLSDKMSVQAFQQIRANFTNLRKQDPQGMKVQFFVATKSEESGILWSQSIPLPIAARLTALSKVAIQMINKTENFEKILQLLFTPSLGDYDFVLKLKTQPLTISSGVLPGSSAFKNLIADTQSYPEDVCTKFDPIRLLVKLLQSKLQGTVIFSSHAQTIDEKGENVLTGLFVPSKLAKSKFKVQIGHNIKPLEKDEVVINKDAIFAEILQYAGDLVVGFDSK